jgi:hypothetical protein
VISLALVPLGVAVAVVAFRRAPGARTAKRVARLTSLAVLVDQVLLCAVVIADRGFAA